MKTIRAQAFLDDPNAPNAVSDLFLANIPLPAHSVIGAYVARESELDPAPLLHALRKRGHSIALPVIEHKNNPLLFRIWADGDILETGPLNIPQPSASAPICAPDLFLVPLLAFDRRGHRLGYGGGYYDRTLVNKKSIGLAFSAQEVPEVPTTSNDVPLDHIITERAYFCLVP